MSRKKAFNLSGSPENMKCTCPIFSVPRMVVLKPPRPNQNFAALLAAATTELSSIAMGMAYSLSLIRKLGAMPRGK